MPKTDIRVQLTGTDGNAFTLMGKVKKALLQAGHKELAQEFIKEAMSGDYNHLLQTCMEYVEVD